MTKNTIICCDGTGNEYGDNNTNVIKLYSVLPKNSVEQVTYYDPGVGTLCAPLALTTVITYIRKILGLAFGYGITKNIADAYLYLMRVYNPGDKVYIFGFSRGAYTARALAALIYKCGLLDIRNDNLVPYVIKQFKFQKKKWIAEGFKRTFSRECPIHFIGIWDTVKSVGWIYNPLVLPYTNSNPSVNIVRHAISIDERRALYRQNLWDDAVNNQDILQVWFAGVHSDIGGSYPENESGLSKIALQWMVEEARNFGLIIDDKSYANVVPKEIAYQTTSSKSEYYYPPDFKSIIHTPLTGFWWLAELLPTYSYNVKLKKREFKWPQLCNRRTINENSYIHESVEQRLNISELNYHPANISENFQVKKTTFFNKV